MVLFFFFFFLIVSLDSNRDTLGSRLASIITRRMGRQFRKRGDSVFFFRFSFLLFYFSFVFCFWTFFLLIITLFSGVEAIPRVIPFETSSTSFRWEREDATLANSTL